MSQSPSTTTTPDDVFYILKFVLSRLLSTGSTVALEKTSKLLIDVMDRDYNIVIKRKLDDVYRNASNAGGPAARGEKAERENRNAYLVRCLSLRAALFLIEDHPRFY